MRLHILVRKGVLGFVLAGLIVSSAAAQAQDKEPAKDAANAEKQVKRQCRKKNTKQANKTYKPKICPLCVPSFPTNEGTRDSQILPSGGECSCPPNFKEKIASQNLIPLTFSVMHG
jgi:hypothetical protein